MHRTAPVSFVTECKSYTSDCKSDNRACKCCQPLQLRFTAIQLTVTRGGLLVEAVIENVTPAHKIKRTVQEIAHESMRCA